MNAFAQLALHGGPEHGRRLVEAADERARNTDEVAIRESTLMTVSALWRRLDTPGHDAAHVSRTDDGWHLEGTAVFAHERGPARLTYWVDCAPDWHTRRGGVTGWVGDRRSDVAVTRSEAG